LPKQSILCGKDGQLFGDNTDGQGLVDAILALNWSLKNTRILILGGWRNARRDLSLG
jgi:shikimate 5-dehydrogenase